MGATGAVGREMISDIEFMFQGIDLDLKLYASSRSAGTDISFRNKLIRVESFGEQTKLEPADVVFMSAGSDFSATFGKKILEETGAILIDNSSAWRMDPEVPLIVPWVNLHQITKKTRMISNPNCSTIQMVIALKPIADHFGLESVHVTTFQSVSGGGKPAIDRLADHVDRDILLNKSQKIDPTLLNDHPERRSFNVTPADDQLDTGFHCFEEVKLIKETRKILELDNLPVFATTARVPVFYCHSEAVSIKIKTEASLPEVQDVFNDHEMICLNRSREYEGFDTPRSWSGRRDVSISRLRLPYGLKKSNHIQMWIVADNLKVGASTNAVAIYKALLEKD